jgi:hypothetical protein
MRIFFKWPGHTLSEVYIDFMFLMSSGEYKIKNPEQELQGASEKTGIIVFLAFK